MKKFFIFIFLIGIFISCDNAIYSEDKEDLISLSRVNTLKSSESEIEGESENIKIGKKLENPYSISNMKKAYAELKKKKGNLKTTSSEIIPNFIYVRFLPTTEADIFLLEKDLNLDLFSYPLDFEITSEGSTYHDPSIPPDNITWQYTKVEKGFNFSKVKDIKYEILQECFIPDDDDLKSGSEMEEIEATSFELLGYKDTTEPSNLPNTKGWFSRYKPKGTLKVLDNKTNTYVGVKGVEVICTTFLRWGKGYTDENGNYEVQRKFMIGPLYSVKFKNNTYGFKIWGLSGPIIGSAVYLMGFHNKKGYNRNFTDGATAWKWATVNNAAYEHFQGKYYPHSNRSYNNLCENAGNGLRLMVIPFSANGATPLTRKIDKRLGVNSHSSWNSFFINSLLGIPVNLIVNITKNIQPDIIIGTKSKRTFDITEQVFHELSHYDHFLSVGDTYWANYVNYIITYGAYGDGRGKNANYCELGEMFGYTMGTYLIKRKYNMVIPDSKGRNQWFKPNKLYYLMDEDIYPLRIIIMSLGEVNNINDFKNRLKHYVSNRDKEIDEAFNNIRPNIPSTPPRYLKIGFVPNCP